MWPLDLMLSREVLRLGYRSAERWVVGADGLTLETAASFRADRPPGISDVSLALRSLYGRSTCRASVVVLESAWLPVMLIEVGAQLWMDSQVASLMRHRFSLLYADSGSSVSAWDVRVDYCAGERWAIGYALDPQLRRVFNEISKQMNIRLFSFVPAWTWAWKRLRPDRHWSGRTGQWAWVEQDRMLLTTFEAGRPAGLNPAMRLCSTTEEIERAADSEAMRLGHAIGTARIAAASWDIREIPKASDSRTRWYAVHGARNLVRRAQEEKVVA